MITVTTTRNQGLPTRPELASRGASAVLACTAWAALTAGLFSGRFDSRAADDLEAGGRFAVNFSLYLPFLALSLVVVTTAVLSLLPMPRTLLPLVVLDVLALTFSLWTLQFQDLYGARPDLPGRALTASGLALLAFLPLTIALSARFSRRGAAPDSAV